MFKKEENRESRIETTNLYKKLKEKSRVKRLICNILIFSCFVAPVLSIVLIPPTMILEYVILVKVFNFSKFTEVSSQTPIYVLVWGINGLILTLISIVSGYVYVKYKNRLNYKKIAIGYNKYLPMKGVSILEHLLILLGFEKYTSQIAYYLFTYTNIEDYFNLIYIIVNDKEIIKKASKIKAIADYSDFEKLLNNIQEELILSEISELIVEINNKYNLAEVIRFNTESEWFNYYFYESKYEITKNYFNKYLKNKEVSSLLKNKESVYYVLTEDTYELSKIIFNDDDLKKIKETQKVILDKLERKIKI